MLGKTIAPSHLAEGVLKMASVLYLYIEKNMWL